MNVHDRRCSCNAVFRLPSLMSRQAQCEKCLRKAAAATMEARKGEQHPSSLSPAMRASAMDVCASGKWPALPRPEPLRVPVKESERMWFRWRDNESRAVSMDFSLVPGEAFTARADGRVFGAGNWSLPMQRGDRAELRNGAIVIGRGKAEGLLASRAEDADRFAVAPTPPKTFEEAVALMRDGWWLEHTSQAVRRTHEGREQVRWRGETTWDDYPHGVGMCKGAVGAGFNRTYTPIRPESPS